MTDALQIFEERHGVLLGNYPFDIFQGNSGYFQKEIMLQKVHVFKFKPNIIFINSPILLIPVLCNISSVTNRAQ